MLNHEKGAPPLYSQLESIIKMQIERGEYNRGGLSSYRKDADGSV